MVFWGTSPYPQILPTFSIFLQMFSLNHPCGHNCPKTCHNINDDGGLEHHKCQEPCERTCRFGHPCPKKCHEPCPPCVAKVVKTLPCTHSQTVMCCRDPNKECRCSTMIIKVFFSLLFQNRANFKTFPNFYRNSQFASTRLSFPVTGTLPTNDASKNAA